MTRRKAIITQGPSEPLELPMCSQQDDSQGNPSIYNHGLRPALEEDPAMPENSRNLSEAADHKDLQFIHTNILIPGRGPPTLDSNVVIRDGKIVFVGPSYSIPDEYRHLLPIYVYVLMPGMWDCQ